MKRLALVVAMLAAIPLFACNTVSGAGKDLQSASNAVEEEIDE